MALNNILFKKIEYYTLKNTFEYGVYKLLLGKKILEKLKNGINQNGFIHSKNVGNSAPL